MLAPLRSRLWVRLAIAFAVASVVPLLGSGFLTLRLLEGSVRRDAADRHRALSRLGASLVHDYVTGAGAKLTTVSRLLARELADPEVGAYGESNVAYRFAVAQRLDGQVEPPDVFLEVVYYAAGDEPKYVGQATQTTYGGSQRPGSASDPLPDTPLVQEPLRTGRLHVSTAPEDRGGIPVLLISAPVATSETPLGVLVAHLDFRRAEEILVTIAQDRYGVRLLDEAGAALASAGAAPDPVQRELEPVGLAGWSVEVAEPDATVFEPLARVRGQVGGWLALGIGLALALGGLAAARIARPLAVLTRTARAMEAGDLGARTHLDRPDEIGRLGVAFDRMAEALQRLDVARSDFVSGVSHELRTPLTSIRLSLANVLDDVVGPVDPRARDALVRTDGDVRRLIEMTNALLEMARLESGGIAPSRVRVDLAELARQGVAAVEPLATARRLSIEVAGEGSAEVDRALAGRVLGNLLDNAVKFTPEGGRIEVAVAEREVRVSDTGPGIDTDGLFEKFRQGKRHGVKNAGFGLGLALAKRIVDLHGGSIEAAPRDGGGTTFTVRW